MSKANEVTSPNERSEWVKRFVMPLTVREIYRQRYNLLKSNVAATKVYLGYEDFRDLRNAKDYFCALELRPDVPRCFEGLEMFIVDTDRHVFVA
jgi:hypothetical protein